jgi:DNA-binding MarR family transcriptional regulator
MKIKKYLEQSPVFAINVAYERIIPALNLQLKPEGLNLLQGLVLTALFFEERGNITPSELSSLFQTSRANMSHIISHLEAKGWVRRGVNNKDARQFHIELKAEGRKKALSMIKFFDRMQSVSEKEMGVTGCRKLAESLALTAGIYKKP